SDPPGGVLLTPRHPLMYTEWSAGGRAIGVGAGEPIGLRRGRRRQRHHVVRQALDIRLAERLGRRCHRAVEIARRLRLEASEELHQVGHILTGQSWNLLVTHEAWPVARDAVVLLSELSAGG